MSFSCLMVAAVTYCSLGAQDVTVERLRGADLMGNLVRVDDQGLIVSQDATESRIPFSEIQSVRPSDIGSVANGSVETAVASALVFVQLRDDSRILAKQFVARGEAATLTLSDDSSLSIPTRVIRWVRLHPPLPELEAQWSDIAARTPTADLLVIRRPGSVLDFIDGTIDGVDQQSVVFVVDGEKIPVDRQRVEGIFYFSTQTLRAERTVCSLIQRNGSQFQVRELRLIGADTIQITFADDMQLAMNLAQVARLDFASRNVVYVSDLEPASVEWSPYLPVPVEPSRLARLYLPRMNEAFDGGPLRLAMNSSGTQYEEFDKGIAVHSRTQLVYRLPGGFQRLAGVVGMSPQLTGGQVVLKISAGDVQWEQVIREGDQPRNIDLDIANAQRLTILVDFADESDVADQLNLCNFRLTK